jgi:MerR family transcriptional regulator, light-induced transcriptional regulator
MADVALNKYDDIAKRYLFTLLEGNKSSAYSIIDKAVEDGITLPDIYVKILQSAMYEVGELWYKNKITVDKEHYCTAVTQSIMAGFYGTIFRTPRTGRTMLACCVSSELHEMGPRMICDIFEMAGWDTVYIGAAVPVDAILHAVKENKPHLLVLSVTMPHHLDDCLEITKAARADDELKNLRIAVGGRAFDHISDPAKKWDADIYTKDAVALSKWAGAVV